MVDFLINAVIDPTQAKQGGQQVERQLQQISNQARSLRTLIGRALGALGVSLGIREIIQLSDSFTNLQNRLKIVTPDVQTLTVVTEELLEVSNRTRSSFEATSELFTRFNLATRELGVSQQDLINFTESLNQAVILSGASTTEAAGGLLQLSQGLASGQLRGEELRSVLEQLPVVADVIAESLDLTRGQLRLFGIEGKISAEIVLTAFEEAREELEERFAKTIPTIGQSVVILRNEFINFVAQLDRSTGASRLVVQAITFLGENLGTLAGIVAVAANVIGVVFAQRAINSAIAGIRALTVAIALNPFGFILVTVTAAISAILIFGDEIQLATNRLATLQDFAVVLFGRLFDLISELALAFQHNFTVIAAIFTQVFGGFDSSLEGFIRFTARIIDSFIGAWIGAFKFVATAFDEFIIALGEGSIPDFQRIGENAGAAFQEGIQTTLVSDFINSVIEDADARRAEIIARQEADQITLARRQALLDALTGETRDRPDREFLAFLAELERENELLRLNTVEREIQAVLFEAEDDLKRELTQNEEDLVAGLILENIALQNQSDILEDLRGPRQDLLQGQAALTELFNSGAISAREFAITLVELQIALLQQSDTAAAGASRGFLIATQDIEDFASTAEDLVTGAFTKAQDVMVEFFQTGKFEVSDFISFISEQFIRLGTQQLFGSLFGGASAGGAGGGGFFSDLIGGLAGGLTSLIGFQHGGSFPVSAATSVGTTPGADNRIIAFKANDTEEVTVSEKGSGRPVIINLNFPNGDVDSFRRSKGQVRDELFRIGAAFNRRNS